VVHEQALMSDLFVSSLADAGFPDPRAVTDLGSAEVAATAEALGIEVALVPSSPPFLSTVRALVAKGISVLVLIQGDDFSVLAECLEAGASGVFDGTQSFENLVRLITDAALGRLTLEPWARQEVLRALRAQDASARKFRALFWALTAGEADVLKLLTEGRKAEEIAATRVVSLAMVRTQIRSILRKLGVNSQLAAVVLAEHAGWPFE
jgi:DNA-binding NarL/FixJ family response regulator